MEMGLQHILLALQHLFFITHVTARPYPGREHVPEKRPLSRHFGVHPTRPLPDGYSVKLKRHDDAKLPLCYITDSSLQDTVPRKSGVSNIVDDDALMCQYAFDGLDIDCWYPGASNQGANPENKEDSVTLLKEPKPKCWESCASHDEPGSCDDDHCDTGHQVQLTSGDNGLGESCYPWSERTKEFCYDTGGGATPFLSIHFENSLPKPPTGDGVDVDSHLNVDNTRGTKSARHRDGKPQDTIFGFAIVLSPQVSQLSLNKLDGSDCEVFDCKVTKSGIAQIVKLSCCKENTPDCVNIHLGHRAPAEITESLPGCGSAESSLVQWLVRAEEQRSPGHLNIRGHAHGPLPETSFSPLKPEECAGSCGSSFEPPKTGCYWCPKDSDDKPTGCETVARHDTSHTQACANNEHSVGERSYVPSGIVSNAHDKALTRRNPKKQSVCRGYLPNQDISWLSPDYPSSGDLKRRRPSVLSYGWINPRDSNDFRFGRLAAPPTDTSIYATEHILEFQLIPLFFDQLHTGLGASLPSPTPKGKGLVTTCDYLLAYWEKLDPADYIEIDNVRAKPLHLVAGQYPRRNSFEDEFVLLEARANGAKEGMWGVNDIHAVGKMEVYEQVEPRILINNVKDCLAAYSYHMEPEVQNALIAQRNRVGDMFARVEQEMVGMTARGTLKPYTPMQLQQRWNAWTRDRAQKAKIKAEQHIENWLESMEDSYATQAQKDAAAKAKLTSSPKTQELIDEIVALRAAYNGRPAWNRPF